MAVQQDPNVPMKTQRRDTRGQSQTRDPEQGAQASVNAARARMAELSPSGDVRAYSGSIYAPPGSYSAAKPATGLTRTGPAAQPTQAPIRSSYAPVANITARQTPVAPASPEFAAAAPSMAPSTRMRPAPPTTSPVIATPPAASLASVVRPTPPPNANALGFSSRGVNAPRGQDAKPGDVAAKRAGLRSEKFASPDSQTTYDNYVKRLFEEEDDAAMADAAPAASKSVVAATPPHARAQPAKFY